MSRDLEWPCVWNNIWKNRLLDHEDRQFLYKLRFRILPTKDVLHKIGKVDEVVCPLCEIENESHEHLFIYCSRTLNAWIFVE